MAITATATAQQIIAEADTPEKVWALVASLLTDGNGYTDATYLANTRAYSAIAASAYKN
jgi:hypothetical protein